LIDAKTGKVVAKPAKKSPRAKPSNWPKTGLKEFWCQDEATRRVYLAMDIFDPKTGQVVFEAGHEMTAEDCQTSKNGRSTNCRFWPSITSMSALYPQHDDGR
jgi:hypothetical protein